MATSTTENVEYLGRSDNIRLANADVELILPAAYGPRILRYAAVGGANVFGEVSPEEQRYATPFGEDWHIYGGHRLWYAPEADPRSYYPDNAPVRVEINATSVRLTQAIEAHTQLEKSIEVSLAAEGSRVHVMHRLTHHGSFDIELAPWALTVMAKGGLGIFPHEDFSPHPQSLAPARPLVLWPFTRMNDARWQWGDRLFCLRHDPTQPDAQKVGFYSNQGFMAYAVDRQLFIKRHRALPGAHADFGCNVETFTNALILELETLGPLTRLAPGASVVHEEEWYLYQGVDVGHSEAEMQKALEPILASLNP